MGVLGQHCILRAHAQQSCWLARYIPQSTRHNYIRQKTSKRCNGMFDPQEMWFPRIPVETQEHMIRSGEA